MSYTDQEVKIHRVSKGAPEQTPNLAHDEADVKRRSSKPKLSCINEENTSLNNKMLRFPKQIE